MSWFINYVYEPEKYCYFNGPDYCCIIIKIRKCEVMNLKQNTVFTKKIFPHIKMDKKL